MQHLIIDLVKAIIMMAFAAVEGYLFGISGMFSPMTFRSQMLFKNFLLMKLFLTGAGVSMIVLSVMSVVDPEKWDVSRRYKHLNNGYLPVIGGCLSLGTGMALAGSGPTIIPTQIGMHVRSSKFIVAGALAGGVAYALLEQALVPGLCSVGSRRPDEIKENGRPSFLSMRIECNRADSDKLTIEDFYGGSYASWALPFGIVLVIVAVFLELVFPHQVDAKALGLPFQQPFLPIAAGAIVGFNQLPIRYISNEGQGGSKSIMNIISTLTWGKLSERFFMSSFDRSWQFVYVWGGTIIGGFIAYKQMQKMLRQAISNSTTDSTGQKQKYQFFNSTSAGFGAIHSFVGGVLMVFGARLAGGCTCGHGISGMSELSVQSMAGAAAIFAGGIVASVFLELKP